ncbi:hypothetical protein MARINON1_40224 [Marinobacter salarius]|nr:hypothetical protein MBHK15_70085 [Marinobacter salarius]VXB22206.1 hypothetical protein MARINON1_40224 [Marinobacter salarius]
MAGLKIHRPDLSKLLSFLQNPKASANEADGGASC